MEIADRIYDKCKKENGWNKRATERMAEKAYNQGLEHHKLKGTLLRWVDGKFLARRAGTKYTIYGQNLFIFQNERLLTVIEVPRNLKKYIKLCKDKNIRKDEVYE